MNTKSKTKASAVVGAGSASEQASSAPVVEPAAASVAQLSALPNPPSEDAAAPEVGSASGQTSATPVVEPATVEPEEMVVVVGPRVGRRRLGRNFTSEPVSIPARDLSAQDIAALHADPHLIVSVVIG